MFSKLCRGGAMRTGGATASDASTAWLPAGEECSPAHLLPSLAEILRNSCDRFGNAVISSTSPVRPLQRYKSSRELSRCSRDQSRQLSSKHC